MLKLLEAISYESTRQFPKLFLDYIQSKPELRNFYKYNPDIEGFGEAIKDREKFPASVREVLYTHLKEQYATIDCSEAVVENIGKTKKSQHLHNYNWAPTQPIHRAVIFHL